MNDVFLNPCPFCGGKAVLTKMYESVDGLGDILPYIKCRDCQCEVSLTYEELWKIRDDYGYTGGYYSNNKSLLDALHGKVIDKWNTRSGKDEKES